MAIQLIKLKTLLENHIAQRNNRCNFSSLPLYFRKSKAVLLVFEQWNSDHHLILTVANNVSLPIVRCLPVNAINEIRLTLHRIAVKVEINTKWPTYHRIFPTWPVSMHMKSCDVIILKHFLFTGLLWGEITDNRWIPLQRPVICSAGVCLSTLLDKQMS